MPHFVFPATPAARQQHRQREKRKLIGRDFFAVDGSHWTRRADRDARDAEIFGRILSACLPEKQ